MTSDKLCELESAKRRTLWVLARSDPDDPKALGVLTILDDLDHQ